MKPRTTNAPSLRDRHAEQTREIILDALIAQLGEAGPFEFSYFDLARRAGVSARTLYRHFPAREDLFAALQARHMATLNVGPYAESPEDVCALAPRIFRAFDREEALVRANLTGSLGQQVRGHGRKERVAGYARAVEAVMPDLTAEERAPYVALVATLLSAEHWRRARDELGLDGGQIGDATEWALRELFRAMVAENQGRKGP